MELIGTVEDIIYKNESNGYMIATFKMANTDTTIVGYLPFVNKGDNLKVIGKSVVHPDYGEQFKVDTFEKIMPQTLDSLEKYLANGLIKGIGPATAKKIVNKFGEETIAVLKMEPSRLTDIKGISENKAQEISESFVENWEIWQIVGYLSKFGIGVQNAQAIYKKLGMDAIDKIQSDPYILVEMGLKVDFAQVDKMALSIGIERSSLRRVGSGIIHALILASTNGHCCVIEENLIKYVVSLLGVSETDVKDGLKDLRAKEKIVIEDRKTATEVEGLEDKTLEICIQKWVYLADFYNTEMNIAQRIISLEEAENTKHIRDIDKAIKQVCTIKLSEKQKEAIKLINENNVTIITGGPGTGKTTIIKTIIDVYKSFNKKVVLCAPTGRAAKRMTEATGEEAKTLHRLLEIGKFDEDKINPKMDVAPIDGDVIIIDESSMMDMFLINFVLKGIFKGTKLILVGDDDQLPSVGAGRVLKDLIESRRVPFIVLNKIFRQAAKSKIIVNSHKVNEGINFIGEIDDEDSLDDFEFITQNNPKIASEELLKLYDLDTQIITPTKKGDMGTKSLNKIIQEKFNPFDIYKAEKKFGDVIFREGDKIMQTKNNYDIEWTKGRNEYGSGIFNGEMGIIETVDNNSGVLTVRFEDGKVADYLYSDLEQIEHCFAITVHKSQGSEFSRVIMPIMQVPPMLLTRNLLYTGMTRAKKKLIMIGNESTVEYMINNINTKVRNTGLKYKLQNI